LRSSENYGGSSPWRDSGDPKAEAGRFIPMIQLTAGSRLLYESQTF
jgi:hypothetical protein